MDTRHPGYKEPTPNTRTAKICNSCSTINAFDAYSCEKCSKQLDEPIKRQELSIAARDRYNSHDRGRIQSMKIPMITFWLNFFVPGLGHLYASDWKGKEGMWLIGINVVCAILIPFIYITAAGCVIVWIYAMVQSPQITRIYNEAATQKEEIDKRESIAKATRVTGKQLAQKYIKLSALKQSGVLSESELIREKAKITSKAVNSWTDEDISEFLAPFAQLKADGSINDDELQAIKKIYMSIYKEPEDMRVDK